MIIKTNGTMNNLESAPEFYFPNVDIGIDFIKALSKSGRHMFIDVKIFDINHVNYIAQELQDVITKDKICDLKFTISI